MINKSLLTALLMVLVHWGLAQSISYAITPKVVETDHYPAMHYLVEQAEEALVIDSFSTARWDFVPETKLSVSPMDGFKNVKERLSVRLEFEACGVRIQEHTYFKLENGSFVTLPMLEYIEVDIPEWRTEYIFPKATDVSSQVFHEASVYYDEDGKRGEVKVQKTYYWNGAEILNR